MPERNSKSRPGKVLCLGTGDGWPCPDRNHSSYLYELADTCLLIDCGESVARSLAARKFDWNRLDAIALSHTHADHVGGLLMLLQGLWLEGRNRDLKILLPAQAINPLRQWLHQAYLFDELFGFKIQFTALQAGKAVQIGNLRLTGFPTTHLDGLCRAFQSKYRVGFDAFGFVLEGAGRRLLHSADLGAPEDLLPLLTKPLDLLVCEIAHFQPVELFSILRGHRIEQAAFVHLTRSLRERLVPVKRLVKQHLRGMKCVFPNDGTCLRF